jgi:DNA-binding NarL/FixJ family response regulator
MSRQISLLLADDHALMRDVLAERLAGEPDMVVVGTVGNTDDAVAQAVDLKPAIVLLDVDMPGVVCFEAARTIQAQCPGTRIIFLSAFFHDRYVEQALAVEAAGYLTKSEPLEVVVKAIRNVAGGGSYFSPEVQARIVIDSDGARLARQQQSRVSTLTPRELEVLRYIARGLSQKEIAGLMRLSPKTVHCHGANLMTKLDIHDRVQLARFAIREGLAEA